MHRQPYLNKIKQRPKSLYVIVN